eukprot:SAG11_NODE_332_length_10621_cov_13.178768_6_plen_210_part_00
MASFMDIDIFSDLLACMALFTRCEDLGLGYDTAHCCCCAGKKTRFFTLGNEMIAYFDGKKIKDATVKKLKGTFPVEPSSTVELKGVVDGAAEQLPWPKGYAFEITSSGRTFKLYAETDVEQRKWTKSVMTMIDYLSKRGSAAGAFSKQISRFAAACVGINQVLNDSVELTNETAKSAMEKMSGKLSGTTADIIGNLVRIYLVALGRPDP